eukprot:TRINITY_DN9631_c0_g1_i1.p1 TRINITY_DN9631_c0_g1~~TRINITY_DN9631_c0_g1_i1.p1  ORF type:complete len:832 (+),score=287.71 TRINITY_DN9631_c0_g1_i1:60-2498(+)
MAASKEVEAAKQMMKGAGVSEVETKKLEDWLGRIDEMETAVKYLLSDESKDDAQDIKAAAEGCEDDERLKVKKQRYSSDYSRFEKDDFVVEKTKKKEIKKDVLPEKPSKENPKELTKYLCKKESLAYKDKGNSEFKAGDYAAAERSYTSGLTLDETNLTLRNNRAQARIKLNNWKGALEDCDIVINEEPLNFKAVKRRAVALMGLRDCRRALADIETAIKYEGASKELRLMKQKATLEAQEEAKVIGADQTTLSAVTSSLATAAKLMDELRVHGPEKPTESPPPTPLNLCKALVALKAAVTVSDATRIHFRWEGGTATFLSFIKDFRNCLSKGATEHFEWDAIPIQIYDILLEAFKVEYNLRCCVEEDALCTILVPQLVSTCSGGKLSSVSSLQLLVRITEIEEVRGALRQHMTAEDLMNLPHHVREGDDGVLSLLLQLVDNLLKSEQWCDDLSGHPLPAYILPLMHKSKSRVVRDSAGAAVMRLTTDAKFRTHLTESKLNLPLKTSSWGSLHTKSQSVLVYLTEYLQEEVASMESPFAVEAILASLCNCLIDNKKEILAVLADVKNIEQCLVLLGSDDARLVNIRARALAFISKCVSVRQVHGYLKKAGAVDVLLKYCVVPKATQVDVERAPTGKVTDAEYARICQENSISVLGAMLVVEEGDQDGEVDELTECVWTTKRVLEHLQEYPALEDVLLGCMLGADRVCGNACLIASVLFKYPEWIKKLSPGGEMIVPLLNVIKKKRIEQRDEEEHCRVTKAPLPSFHLNGQAQKNAAISLARLAKDPTNLGVLRENQGIDILSTTLKYTNQAG